MTPEDRKLIEQLYVSREQPEPISSEDFLRRIGKSDGTQVAHQLLMEAVESKSSLDLELALRVAFRFGVDQRFTPPLSHALYGDWHVSHENIVSLLDKLRSPDAIPSLVHAVRHVPDYLDFDEARALAVKAIWALGNLPGHAAEEALGSLLDSDNEIVLTNIRNQLKRRGVPTPD